MRTCCVCGQKLGIFGEERYSITEDYVLCYKCAPLLRGMKESKDEEQFYKNQTELRAKMDTFSVSKEVRSVIELEMKELGYQRQQEDKRKKLNAHIDVEQRAKLRRMRETFMVNTGYNFEGYRITQYLGLIHGELVLGTGFLSELTASISDLFGASSKTFQGKIAEAKSRAQEQMIVNAIIERGANAIIGIDFDIITFSNNMIAVSVNGTAVMVEKIIE